MFLADKAIFLIYKAIFLTHKPSLLLCKSTSWHAITNFVFTNLGPGAGGGSAPTTPTANTGSSGSSSSSGGSGSSGTAKGECPDDTDCKSDFSGSSKNPPKVDGKEKAPDKKSTNSCKNTSEGAAGNYCAGATKNAQIGGKCQPKLGTGADCKVDSHESCKSGNCAMSSSKGEIVAKCQ